MKIKPQQLREAFLRVAKLAGSRATMPILKYILVSTADGRMSLSASNQEADATASFECAETTEPFCINADTVGKLVSGTGERELDMQVTGEKLLVKSPFRATIPILPGKDFIPLPKPAKKDCLGINCEDLAAGINAVSWAADPKGAIADLWRAAVHIVTTPNAIICSGTDSKTVAHWKSAAIGVDSDVMIPCYYASMLADVIGGENADYYVSDTHVFGVSDALTISVKRFNGNYVNVGALIDGAKTLVGESAISALLDELMLCGGVVNPERGFTPCRLDFSATGISVSAKEAGREFESSIPGVFPTSTFRCDSSRLISALKNLSGETVKIELIGDRAIAMSSGDLICAMSGLIDMQPDTTKKDAQ